MKRLFLALLCTAPVVAFAQSSVLVVDAAGDAHTDLDSALSTVFTTVDTFDLQTGTPLLPDLAPYDAVVAFTDSAPTDPAGTGDALADYVDQGGCVVMATYSMSTPWAITGRIATTGYNPLVNNGTNGSVSGNLNVLVPSDPVFQGVDIPSVVYDWNSNFAIAGLDAGATLLADDGNGINMIARNVAGNVVGMNFFPADYYNNNGELYSLFSNAAADCSGVAVSSTANFKVTKVFSDNSEGDVEVTLTCNSGLPLQQSFMIAGGDLDGVTFVVTDLPDTGADCAVTESGGHDNYTSVMNGGAGCEWTGVTGGLRTCEIMNEANPATYTVTKDWVVQDEQMDEVDYSVDVSIVCDSDILAVGGVSTNVGSSTMVSLDGEDSVDVMVETLFGPASCSAEEYIVQSGVESEASDECSGAELGAGGSAECVFTNTVFFEGIPTLSQYGMAIMALLMLGVGFVGFRRFV